MAKDGKLKVPKRIAGVKVPKKVRKTANKALKVADSPLAMELAAAALAAAAASLRQKGAPRAGAATAAGAGSDGIDRIGEQAGKLRDLVVAAALDGARRLMDGAETPEAAAAAAKKPAPKRRPKASAAPAPAAAPRDA